MEFEFRKDFISGEATVKLSMDHEAFATWLEQEGQSINWVEDLLENISRVQQRVVNEIKLAGSEFSLLLNEEEAQVINHSLLNNFDEIELEGDLSFYDLEIEASCGFEDFLHLIESWLLFLQNK
ncbi:YacL family protein [Psychromonas sp.]|uniref:YacL family protein n=1 Tax=Psychromonas sp. TaxID=1884585 RepID=UPI003568062C